MKVSTRLCALGASSRVQGRVGEIETMRTRSSSSFDRDMAAGARFRATAMVLQVLMRWDKKGCFGFHWKLKMKIMMV